MTVRREYRCNLCSATITDTSGGATGGVGIHFGHPHLKLKMIGDAENHLCSECLEGIKAELASLDKASNRGDGA